MTHLPDGYQKPDFDDFDSAGGWWRETAPQAAVDYVLKANQNSDDGRSQWVWIRLPNGDLVLAVYPQGDTYFSTEAWRTI